MLQRVLRYEPDQQPYPFVLYRVGDDGSETEVNAYTHKNAVFKDYAPHRIIDQTGTTEPARELSAEELYGTCAICGEPFVDEIDYDNRHTVPATGEDCHEYCCPDPLCNDNEGDNA